MQSENVRASQGLPADHQNMRIICVFDPKTIMLKISSVLAPPQGCNNVLFFEARKHQDLYLWIAKSPDGPSAKFLVLNGEKPLPFAFLHEPLAYMPLIGWSQ